MSGLVCFHCGQKYPEDALLWRCDCGGVLNLDFSPALVPDSFPGCGVGLWRYLEALPVTRPLSLGEPFTPLVSLLLGGREVLVKQEQLFPTGSYKDRGAAVLVARAGELGIKEVVEDSSGNAGCAVAAYCAAAGIGCRIFVPAGNSPSKLAQIKQYGAKIVEVPGSREDTATACMAVAESTFYASHVWNPWFLHGTKTFAYELAEQMDWQVPDACILPAGNGTLLLGAWLGFSELMALGFTTSMPRLVAVQAAACAPLACALRNGRTSLSDEIAMEEPGSTMAEGIAIAAPPRGAQMLQALRETGGMVLTVSEGEINRAFQHMARRGYCIEPTSAAVIAGAARYCTSISDDQIIVTAFTGHGLKAELKDFVR